ncbi:TPA: hypothetical protein RNX54_002194, partial [Pasteurella multocida]|nr:hypothetical protein [Pasteurella multocida]
ATYTAKTVGKDLKATLKLAEWTKGSTSDAYAIHVLEFGSITVNDHQFSMNDGFPTTGFVGATFTLNLKDGVSASDVDWKVDGGDGWVSVNNGVVKFTGEGTSSKVTITATPKTGGGTAKYSFNLKTWFVHDGTERTWSSANSYCQSQSMSLPTRAQLTNGTESTDASRAGNSLWSEWGDIRSYGFAVHSWASEAASGSTHYYVHLSNGNVGSGSDSNTGGYSISVMCQRGL